MKRLGVGGLLALGLLLVPGAALGASPTTCTVTVTGTVGPLVVPSGATCTLDGATVQGDVKVLSGGTLNSTSATSTIQGSLVNRGGAVQKFCGNINGRISSVGGRLFVIDANDCLRHYVAVGGPISISGVSDVSGSGYILLEKVRTPASVTIAHNSATQIYVFGNTIGGALSVTDNRVITQNMVTSLLVVSSNEVGGGTIVSRNTVDTFLGVQNNRISGSLSCNGNTPPPTVSGNKVSGATTGQCKEA